MSAPDEEYLVTGEDRSWPVTAVAAQALSYASDRPVQRACRLSTRRLNAVQAAACKSAVSSSGMSI